MLHQKVEYHLKELRQLISQECQCRSGCGKCASEFDLYIQYANAGIPVKYWRLNPEIPLSKSMQLVQNYLQRLKLAYEDGHGIFAYGKNGNGKTLSACLIGKEAIRQGYSVRFTFLGEVISAFMNTMYDTAEREKLQEDILGVDFLILDDIDKAYISKESKYVSSILDSLFRTRVQNCLPVIMTANKPITDILESDEEVFSKSLISLFDESLSPIMFLGNDRRAEIKKKARKKFLE